MMKLRLYVSAVLALATLLVPRLWAQGIETDAILKARQAALTAGDLHAILRVFADDAVVATSSRRIRIGKEQTREWV
jgi:ketosteroid isomerase-like protein